MPTGNESNYDMCDPTARLSHFESPRCAPLAVARSTYGLVRETNSALDVRSLSTWSRDITGVYIPEHSNMCDAIRTIEPAGLLAEYAKRKYERTAIMEMLRSLPRR